MPRRIFYSVQSEAFYVTHHPMLAYRLRDGPRMQFFKECGPRILSGFDWSIRFGVRSDFASLCSVRY